MPQIGTEQATQTILWPSVWQTAWLWDWLHVGLTQTIPSLHAVTHARAWSCCALADPALNPMARIP